MGQHIVVWSRVLVVTEAILVAAMLSTSPAYAGQDQGQIALGFDIQRQILRGFQIAPVRLNFLSGKDAALVGLGSYIVNTTGCNV
jgi:hypothetical protein